MAASNCTIFKCTHKGVPARIAGCSRALGSCLFVILVSHQILTAIAALVSDAICFGMQALGYADNECGLQNSVKCQLAYTEVHNALLENGLRLETPSADTRWSST